MKKVIYPLIFVLLVGLSFACKSDNKQKEGADGQELIKVENIPEENRIDVTIGGEPFTSYMYADSFEKPFLFPIIAASGTNVTRGYPIDPKEGERADHPHHTGYWFNYGNVDGIDFWGNSKAIADSVRYRYGVIRMKSIDKLESQAGKGLLEVTHQWVNSEGTILVQEEVTYVFTVGKDSRSIERTSTLSTPLPEVSFSDTKEGAFAVRTARFLEFPSDTPRRYVDANGKTTENPVLRVEKVSGNYLSSEGVEGSAVWGTRAKWMKLYGVNLGDTVSLVMMDHPSNLNHPTYWHARTYGLFSANPFGVKDFTRGEEELNFVLKSGEKVSFKHKLLIKSGQGIPATKIEEEWSKFSTAE